MNIPENVFELVGHLIMSWFQNIYFIWQMPTVNKTKTPCIYVWKPSKHVDTRICFWMGCFCAHVVSSLRWMLLVFIKYNQSEGLLFLYVFKYSIHWIIRYEVLKYTIKLVKYFHKQIPNINYTLSDLEAITMDI